MATPTDVGRQILVVAQAPALTLSLIRTFSDRSQDTDLVVMTNFARAKRHLMTGVDILITEVKLGAYNGLHLAVRALAAGIPSIVIGPDDEDFKREATRLGAAYVSGTDLSDGILETLVTQFLAVRNEVTGFLPWRPAN
jgi:hypothetical protein